MLHKSAIAESPVTYRAVGTYSPYAVQHRSGSNTTVETVATNAGTLDVFYSYETPIGFRVHPVGEPCRCYAVDRKFSRTTSKHQGFMHMSLPDAEMLSESAFIEALRNARSAIGVPGWEFCRPWGMLHV